ncbi:MULTISPECIES: class I SAM-dependent methyltransferase [unclassified Adlercreutzia]|uniref:class I SAM-dependent methyltransferase n=1 Tax=unclassified Adlercreutzia TaxID=2636013 RepID=UPI0013EA65A9|nr:MULTISPECIES: class I SAM-dependent methyltransferase [unclassified Adlercreutzia]
MAVRDRDNQIEFFASCLAGFEAALADELRTLRVRSIRPLKGGAAFLGRPIDAERVCLWSRVASRVTAVVGRVNAGDAELLYAGVYNLAWEDVLAPGASVAVRAFGTNAELRNTQFTALKVKDALCDRLRARTGERPNVSPHDADLLVDVRVRDRRATISVDLAGASLYHRAYFDGRDGEDAPLACARAAGMLVAAGAPERLAEGWGVLDPACDAGFAVCEAAGMAADAAPGLLRERWGFYGWAQHDDAAWSDELARADERLERGLERLLAGSSSEGPGGIPDPAHVRVVGLSTSSPAIARARAHLRNAGLRAVASVEAASLDDAAAVERRLAGVVGKGAGAPAAPALPGTAPSDVALLGAAPSAEALPDVAAEGTSAPAAPALLVVNAAPIDRDEGDARAVAEEAAFMAAAKGAPAGSVFAAVGTRGFAGRFGVEPTYTQVTGAGRIEGMLEVFDQPPRALASITLPDAHGGADHVVEVNDGQAAQFAARLRKVARERRKWARREGISCYRLYDADLPDYNVAIDVYEGAGASAGKTYVHVAEYQAPSSVDAEVARRRFDDVLAVVPVVLDVRPDHVFSKVRTRSKGGSQYQGAHRRSYVAYTEEAGLTFEIDLGGYLDTGIFLDHRVTRGMVGEEARGARFLNLFAYTGTATVHAAAGGAAETTTVDLSQTYLDWARRNMELNGFAGREHAFVRADVMEWIHAARRAREEFDLIFVDPPTFSNSKAMGKRTWDVQRDHVELLIGVSRLLARGGAAVFSCNLRTFKPDCEQLERYGVELEDMTADTIPHDFERNPRIHQCYLVRRAERTR